jgi:carbon-monoxide dehydrogenase large subunit
MLRVSLAGRGFRSQNGYRFTATAASRLHPLAEDSHGPPIRAGIAVLTARRIRDKAKRIAAHLLEVSEADLVWEPGKFSVKGAPQKAKTIQEIAFAAYTNHPPGMEAGLEAVAYPDPPNLTFFGSYIRVVDVDRGTGMVTVRRFLAVDDCGNIINPMVVDGQIHGRLTQGLAPALYEEMTYGEQGNNQTVGAPPAIASAVVDALAHLGVRHIDIPIRPEKVWRILKEKGAAA